MENSESGDDMGHAYLTADPPYIVQSDELDMEGNEIQSEPKTKFITIRLQMMATI